MQKPLLATLFIAAPRAAFACPVCFGQSDSPMAWGTNMGIFLMLGVTVAVLGGFASFFVYLMRRARMFGNGADSVSGPASAGSTMRGPDETGRRVEGTA